MAAGMGGFWWFLHSSQWSPEDVTAAGTVILAAMTIIMAGGTWFLWLATKRLATSTEQSAERQMRAYLAVSPQSDPPGVREGGILVAHNKISVRLFVVNRGQTPAYDVRDWCDIKVLDEPRALDMPKLRNRLKDVRSVIAPGDAITVAREKTPGISAEEARRIKGGSALIYIYGTITYRDAFGESRYTNFRLYTNLTAGNTDNLSVAEEGNDAN